MLPLALSVAAPIVGGLISGLGAKSASRQQERALREAMAQRERFFGEAQNAWKPYAQGGQQAWELLAPLLGLGQDSGNPLTGGGSRFGALTRDFNPADLSSTPGYQWNLDQTMRALTNAATRHGLGGNLLTALGKTASGLAEQTYGNEFARYWDQNKNIFNMLFSPTQQGAQGAQSLTAAATQTGAGQANDLTGVGNARAAGTNALYGGIAQGVQGAANAFGQHAMYGPLIQAQTDYFRNATGGGGSGGYGNAPGQFNPNVPGGFIGADGSNVNPTVANPLMNSSWMPGALMGGYGASWPPQNRAF